MRTVTPAGSTRTWLPPLALAVAFVAVVEGLSLVEFLPVPVALLVALGWGVGIGLLATWLRGRATLAAWLEDGLVALGVVTMALFAFGGAAGLLMLDAALESPTLTGQTLVLMFLPSIPVAILGNVPTELVVIPMLLVLGWRPGRRRILIVVAAALYFVHRVWTYLVFSSARLDFAETERSTTPLTEAERERLGSALHVDDPRWILNLVIFAVFLLAAHFSRVREPRTPARSVGS
ncbi:hypothetical protein C6361_08540 [Plantactinospora sp. BC1]|uniref:hypothetical protein n=1 Tax=Plantactinospora sp. BC1 TaxID=2108470 RepID=UPI000D15AC98|nr:hypothetical protein [Plantactinospora sp. BC1]AVT29536.1 hypothetical protein C6361_08540 [Plantactinospora sp. BC1]